MGIDHAPGRALPLETDARFHPWMDGGWSLERDGDGTNPPRPFTDGALPQMSSSIDRIRRRVPLRPLLFLIAGALFAVNLAVPGTQPPTATGPATYDQVDAWLAHQIADSGIPGGAVVIVRDGQVVHTQAFGTADATGRPVTAETPFVIG